jgi:hypothetical protein
MWLDGELGWSLGFMINSGILRNSVGLVVRAKKLYHADYTDVCCFELHM